MNESDSLASSLQRTLDRIAHQPLGSKDRNRLDAHTGVGTNLLLAALQQVFIDEFNQAANIGAALLELDARVHILRVLAEDDNVNLLRVLHRARHTLVVLHRPHTGVEIQQLAQSYVERTNASADRCRQRSLDGNAQVARCRYRVVG